MDLLQVCWLLAALSGALALPPGRQQQPRRNHRGAPTRRAHPPPPPQRPARSSLVYALAPPPQHGFQHADAPTFTFTQDQYLSALRSLSESKHPLEQPKTPVYHSRPLQPYSGLLPTPHPVHEQQAEPEDGAGDVDPPAAVDTAPAHPAPTHAAHPVPTHVVHSVQEVPANHRSVYPVHLEEPSDYAAKYQFGYHVRDPKHGSYFGHSEAREGRRTKGEYHVLLPDGRLQNVQYWADPSGYHAQVSYDGVARHYQ